MTLKTTQLQHNCDGRHTKSITPTANSQFVDTELRQNLQRMQQAEQAERDRRAELARRRELARWD
jgi:hypothetical protein